MHPFGGHLSRHWRSSNPADAYLSYYDVRLSKEDIQVLKNDWLTDNVISFWEEYLTHEYLVDFKNSRIELMKPSMVQMLKQTNDPTSLKSALPDFSSITHVFLPVNDCEDAAREPEGGSHWSLLLVSIVDGVAFHYDSMGCNEGDAFKVTRQLQQLLNVRLRYIHLHDTPQQENGSDCGVYVCLFMKHLLLKRLLMVKTNEKVSMSMGNKRIDAKEGRKEMLRIIEERRREGERRRSMSKSPGPDRAGPPRIASPLGT